jgi:hypothetical protein
VRGVGLGLLAALHFASLLLLLPFSISPSLSLSFSSPFGLEDILPRFLRAPAACSDQVGVALNLKSASSPV